MVYQRLGLGDFEQVRPALEAYFADTADYQTNRYQLAPELRTEIARRWGAYVEKHGYYPGKPASP